MQAIILAGGFGTRLSGIVADLPKPMAAVAGRPFLCWLLEYAQAQGVSEAVLCVHHMHDIIHDYFGKYFAGIRLEYSVEDAPLGTGGAVKKAMEQLQPDEPVFVMNGDSLVQLDYRKMRAAHEGSLTLATRHVADTTRYSKLQVEGNFITDFALTGDRRPGIISAGFYLMSADIFDGYDMPEIFSLERDFFARHVPEIQPVAYEGVEYFIDIGVPEDYARAQEEIPARMRETIADY